MRPLLSPTIIIISARCQAIGSQTLQMRRAIRQMWTIMGANWTRLRRPHRPRQYSCIQTRLGVAGSSQLEAHRGKFQIQSMRPCFRHSPYSCRTRLVFKRPKAFRQLIWARLSPPPRWMQCLRVPPMTQTFLNWRYFKLSNKIFLFDQFYWFLFILKHW